LAIVSHCIILFGKISAHRSIWISPPADDAGKQFDPSGPDPQLVQQFLSRLTRAFTRELNVFYLPCAVVAAAPPATPSTPSFNCPSAVEDYRYGLCSEREQCGYSSQVEAKDTGVVRAHEGAITAPAA